MARMILGEAPVWSPPPQDNLTVWTLALRTITPMFGGSAKPREVDTNHPIRAASIRGHLRFWWRATAGANFDSAEKLFQAESELWGSTETPGTVEIRVEMSKSGDLKKCAQYEMRDGRFRAFPTFERNWPPYALQPFQGKAGADEPGTALLNVQFNLRLIIPADRRAEIEQAVFAWIHFGGIGARTRRGCGSLAMMSDGIVGIDRVDGTGSPFLTVLPGRYYKTNAVNDPLLAWELAVNTYRDFRQKPGFARNPGREPNRPGRSRWPEADSIRRITSRHSSAHLPQMTPERAFPRADLGLPITFHFKDEGQGDPLDTTLEGNLEGLTRFASPVITKVIALPDNQYAPVIVILNSPHVWKQGDLQLKNQEKRTIATIGENTIHTQAQPMGRHTDIREALAEYIKTCNFQEVAL